MNGFNRASLFIGAIEYAQAGIPLRVVKNSEHL
jgi:hypothetical protein